MGCIGLVSAGGEAGLTGGAVGTTRLAFSVGTRTRSFFRN